MPMILHLPLRIFLSHNTAIILELQDTVADLRREISQLKEQAVAREQELAVSITVEH